nr:class I SAM-dependent methyltransferase [Pseudoalteromonas spiralis]
MKTISLIKKTLNVLEIGCSSGEVLAELKTIYSNVDYHGIEPNEETAIAAEKKELIVEKVFSLKKLPLAYVLNLTLFILAM